MVRCVRGHRSGPCRRSEATLEIMTLEHRELSGDPFATPAIVADIIASLDVDIVVTQETRVRRRGPS